MKKMMIGMTTMNELEDWFSYNPETGLIFWKKKRSNRTNLSEPVGSNNGNGYLVAFFHKKKIYNHRLAWYLYYGEWAKEIDHVNRDRADNRIENLRSVTRRQNCQNTEKFNKGAKFDGYAWRSFITIDNRKIDLGRYNTEQEAQESYERAVLSR